jgi:hypothetical protein
MGYLNKSLLFILIFICSGLSAQEKPYYYEIPAPPAQYSAETVAARLVDGLGFRYYWATEGLTDDDLSYRPSPEARTSLETLQHIRGLSFMLLNTVQGKVTGGQPPGPDLSFTELRSLTLENIRLASHILKSEKTQLENLPMIFERPQGKTEYPFWNLINGPVSDALWHVGQIVSFRRSSGNPLPPGVNVLSGTKRE